MRKKIIGAACLLGAVLGCGEVQDCRIGFGVRQIKARSSVVDYGENVPFVRLQGNSLITENLESYLRFDATSGSAGTMDYVVEGDFYGRCESAGAGLSWYPFVDNFSLDFGVEVFHAKGVVESEFKISSASWKEEIFGWGANVGASFDFPIGEGISVFGSGGYNFTDNSASGRVFYDFDGWNFFGGLKFEIPSR